MTKQKQTGHKVRKGSRHGFNSDPVSDYGNVLLAIAKMLDHLAYKS